MKICKECDKPGEFPIVYSYVVLKKTGILRAYAYERDTCTGCVKGKAKQKRILKKKKAMEEQKAQQNEQRKTPKPYKELLGPSTHQMRLEGKIKRKDHHTDSKDNGRVAFGY